MDDFGSGYSSLNMLTSLPIDALKLDMKFIRNITEDTKASRLVGIMIDIARLLEVPVIAEGVETKEQMELLKSIGCDIIQGYYFSKPLPPEEFKKLIV
jgi:EAL domain-containing protein (putative c-di-GMP-specific phosphodiesterase class I)